jgi:hypothetical protein
MKKFGILREQSLVQFKVAIHELLVLLQENSWLGWSFWSGVVATMMSIS